MEFAQLDGTAVRPRAELVRQYVESLGIIFIVCRLREILGKDAPVLLQESSSKMVVPSYDCILMSVGVRANTEVAAEIGLDIGRRIKVNTAMVTSCPEFSLGDVSRNR